MRVATMPPRPAGFAASSCGTSSSAVGGDRPTRVLAKRADGTSLTGDTERVVSPNLAPSLLRIALLAALAFGAAGCAASLPPFTHASIEAGDGVDKDKAFVIFVWPSSSCDPGGYYTLATAEGRVVG